MALTELEQGKLLALGADADGDGKVSRAEMADALGLEGQKYLTKEDYERYADDFRPDLNSAFDNWGGRGRQIRSDSSRYGGSAIWYLEVRPELVKGLALVGELEGELGDIHVEDAYNECRKEGMGGKANSKAGFACWNVWHSAGDYNVREFEGLVPTGVRISTEKIQEALATKELSRSQQKKLMTLRFGGMGINEINEKVSDIQRGISYTTGKEIDFRSAMLLYSSDPPLASSFKNYRTYQLILKGAEENNPRAIEMLESVSDEEKAKYANPPEMPDMVSENETGFFVDLDSVDETLKAMTPYDFEKDAKVYGVTTNKFDANGNRIEKEGEWFSSQGGWVEHPKFGTVNEIISGRPGWSYSTEMGWYYQDKSKSDNWIWTEKTGKWLWPETKEGAGIYFYASDTDNPSESEWLYPNYDTSSFYDFNDNTWRSSEDIKNGYDSMGETLEQVEPQEEDQDADLEMENVPNNVGESDLAEEARANQDNTSDPAVSPNPDQPLGPEGWYEDEFGVYFEDANTPNWKMYNGDDYKGWWYDDPNSDWNWSEETGWVWNNAEETGSTNWFYSNKKQDWVYAQGDELKTNWVLQTGEAADFSVDLSDDGDQNPDEGGGPPAGGSPPIDYEVPGEDVADPISYDNTDFEDPTVNLNRYRDELDEIAQNYRYKGYGEGFIASAIKSSSVYKKIMGELGGDDAAEARGLVDDIVNTVAKQNAIESNQAGALDMFDTRGGGMLDPTMSVQQKLAIRLAKPSIQATQDHVNEGLASEVGELIRNPDYDPDLSYYFEHVDPETGELVTKAFRPDMPAKQPAMGVQERLIDSSIDLANDHMDLLTKKGEDGKTDYQRRYDNVMDLLREEGLVSTEGGDDLYTKEALKQINYIYGDDEDSYSGKREDYNEMQKYLRDQSNYLRRMDNIRDLDNTSKLRTAIGDVDPKINARNRGLDRIKLARFGGGSATADNNIRTTGKTLFEGDIRDKIEAKNINAVTGLGDTYTQDELDAAGVRGGLKDMPQMTEDLRDNQYAKNIIAPGIPLSDTERAKRSVEEAQSVGRRPKYIGPSPEDEFSNSFNPDKSALAEWSGWGDSWQKPSIWVLPDGSLDSSGPRVSIEGGYDPYNERFNGAEEMQVSPETHPFLFEWDDTYRGPVGSGHVGRWRMKDNSEVRQYDASGNLSPPTKTTPGPAIKPRRGGGGRSSLVRPQSDANPRGRSRAAASRVVAPPPIVEAVVAPPPPVAEYREAREPEAPKPAPVYRNY